MGLIVGLLLAVVYCVWIIYGIVAAGAVGSILLSNLSILLVIGFILLIVYIANGGKKDESNDKFIRTIILHILFYLASCVFVSLSAMSLSDMNEYTGFETILSTILLLFLNLPAFSATSKGKFDVNISVKQEKALIFSAIAANLLLGLCSFYPYIIHFVNAEQWNVIRYSPSVIVYICPSIMAMLYLRVVYKGVVKYIKLTKN